jgi:putative transposase
VVNSLGKNKRFKFKITRPWCKVKTISILRDTDNCLYLVVTCDVEVKQYEPKEDMGPIGVDFGLKCFLTLSDGSKGAIPDFNKLQKKVVSKADRSYSFKSKAAVYGTNFKRAKKIKAKAHRKEANQRSDFHWKLAHELCKHHSFIGIEDLNLDGMKRLWGRKVSNLGYGEFIQKLMIVAEKYGTEVVKVDRFFASSQTCSDCGYVNKDVKNLTVREWVCPVCGCVHDRDVNAAKNILSSALSLRKAKMGRALPISEVVVNRAGSDLETSVDWRSLASPIVGSAEQESHVL